MGVDIGGLKNRGISTVDRRFDDEQQDFTNAVGRPVKKQKIEEPGSLDHDSFHRHRAFLMQIGQNVEGAETSHRPKKVHRTSAKRCLDHLDEELRQISMIPGLCYFQADFERAAWADANWRLWPHMSGSGDLGPDNVAAENAAEYYFMLNAGYLGDTAHGVHCDHKLLLNERNLANFWLCMAISWNLVHGPDKNHERKHQLRSMLARVYAGDPRDCLLFMASSDRISKCLHALGYDFPCHVPHCDTSWEILRTRAATRPDGERCSFGRFAAAITCCNKHTPWWYVDAFERAVLAIETDVIKGASLAKVKVAKESVVEEGGTPLNPSSLAPEDKASMKCCSNAIAHSAVMTASEIHRKYCVMLGENGQLFKDFYVDPARCRDAQSTSEWMVRMVTGGIQQRLVSFFKQLADYGVLERLRLRSPAVGDGWSQ